MNVRGGAIKTPMLVTSAVTARIPYHTQLSMASTIWAIVRGSSLLVLLNSLLVLSRPQAHVPVEENMRTFSNAIKGGHFIPGEEYLLYESDTGEPGVITEQWFTGKMKL